MRTVTPRLPAPALRNDGTCEILHRGPRGRAVRSLSPAVPSCCDASQKKTGGAAVTWTTSLRLRAHRAECGDAPHRPPRRRREEHSPHAQPGAAARRVPHRARRRPGSSASRSPLARPVDAVLMDVQLPDIDGLDRARAAPPGPARACPVIMMSGHGTIETAVKATRLGARDFLEKPIGRDRLLVALRNALEHRGSGGGAGVAPRRGRQVRDGGTRPGDAAALPPGPARGTERGPRPHHRRERHRQGAGRPRAPPEQPARLGTLRPGELRGGAARAHRERALRPREGRLHRRARAAAGKVRARLRRHPLPRRGGRHAGHHAGQAAPRAAGVASSSGWAAPRR